MQCMSASQLIVIGASAGGVSALLRIARDLPAPFPAPVCIVQHVGRNPSLLPELLQYAGPNRAVHASHGDKLRPGTLYVAPPDRHVLVDGDTLSLTHGARENYARPAIDPLFRSAAATWTSRVIAVVLTGQMDDGAAGLRAVQDCGGTTVVQDPADAEEPEMPRSALAAVDADHCVPLSGIAPLLEQLARAAAPAASPPVPEAVLHEVAIHRGDMALERLNAMADPSPLACPECGGGLSEVRAAKPLRFRCHTGHGFTARALQRLHEEGAEQALWATLRTLRERELLLQRVSVFARATGDEPQAQAALASATQVRAQIRSLVGMVQGNGDEGDEGGPA